MLRGASRALDRKRLHGYSLCRRVARTFEAIEARTLADQLGNADAVRAWLLGGGELSTVGYVYPVAEEIPCQSKKNSSKVEYYET